MATKPETYRKRLERLQQDYRATKRELDALDIVMPGSVVTRSYRCGKKSCRCHRDPNALHGPYHQWTCKVKGKTVGMTLEPSVAPIARQWIRNDRKMRRLTRRLHQIARKMLKVMVELEKAKRESPGQ